MKPFRPMLELRDVVKIQGTEPALKANASERIDVALARMRAEEAAEFAVFRRGRYLGAVRAADLDVLVRAEALSRHFE